MQDCTKFIQKWKMDILTSKEISWCLEEIKYATLVNAIYIFLELNRWISKQLWHKKLVV